DSVGPSRVTAHRLTERPRSFQGSQLLLSGAGLEQGAPCWPRSNGIRASCTRVGFIVSNLSRPAERGHGCHAGPSPPTGALPAPRAGIQAGPLPKPVKGAMFAAKLPGS